MGIFVTAGHGGKDKIGSRKIPYKDMVNAESCRVIFIYTLSDPIAKIVRYVGKTDNPTRRYNKHIHSYKKQNSHCASWIKSLYDKGLKPIMELIDTASPQSFNKKEQDYIKMFMSVGARLTNKAVGGNIMANRMGKTKPTNHTRKTPNYVFEKEELVNLYIRQNKSISEIIKIKGCGQTTVKNYLRRYGIKKAYELWMLNNPIGERSKKYNIDKEMVKQMRTDGKTIKNISEYMDVPMYIISNILYPRVKNKTL